MNRRSAVGFNRRCSAVAHGCITAGLYLFGISLASTKSGLDIAVSIVSLGVLCAAVSGRLTAVVSGSPARGVLRWGAAFLTAAALSLVGAADPASGAKRFVTLLGFAGLTLGVLATEDERTLHRVIVAVALMCAVQAVIAVLQHVTGIDLRGRTLEAHARGRGTLGYPNDLGFVYGVVIPFLAAAALAGSDRRTRLILGISLVFSLVGLGVTFTRGAWLGVFVGLLAMGALRDRRLLAGAAILALLAVAVPGVRHRIVGTSPGTETARIRFVRLTPPLIAERPILGWGLDGFREVFYRRYPDFPEQGHFHPHNVLLSVAFQMGIIGLIGFLGLFGAAAAHCIRTTVRDRSATGWLAAGCLGSIADFFVHGMFDEPLRAYQAPYAMFFVMAVVLRLGSAGLRPPRSGSVADASDGEPSRCSQ